MGSSCVARRLWVLVLVLPQLLVRASQSEPWWVSPRRLVGVERWPPSELTASDKLVAGVVGGSVLHVVIGRPFVEFLCKENSAIVAGQWWRFVTPAVVHANPIHLYCNMRGLQAIGPDVERWFGADRFWMTVLGSTAAGTFASFRCCPSPSVGASGAVFGLVGAEAVFLARHRELFGRNKASRQMVDRRIDSLVNTVAINLALGLLIPGIDNFGHVGGLVGGAAVAYLAGPRLVRDSWTRRMVDRPIIDPGAWWRAAQEGRSPGAGTGRRWWWSPTPAPSPPYPGQRLVSGLRGALGRLSDRASAGGGVGSMLL